MSVSRTILIAGPTASGKSGLALALAEQIGGTVINADSMQVYRELRVLTARPSAEDEQRAPHVLYGHMPGAEAYSAGRYALEAAAAISEARTKGLLPIIVGGTGLYFKTLTDGLSPIPAIDAAVRQHWRGEQVRLGSKLLHDELQKRDPVMAERLNPNDPQRVTRALEVLDSTGRSLAEWQKMPGTPIVDPGATLRIVVAPGREEIWQRSDVRLDWMMDHGAVEEVAELAALDLDPSLPVMRALGVRPLLQFVRGDIGRAVAADLVKAETRQYIKRQQTWLGRNMITWNHICQQEKQSLLDQVMAFIRR